MSREIIVPLAFVLGLGMAAVQAEEATAPDAETEVPAAAAPAPAAAAPAPAAAAEAPVEAESSPDVEEAAAPAAESTSAGEVARFMVTTGIDNREPVDDIDSLPAAEQSVYFFTELHGMKGQTVTHRWEHDGEVKAEVNFNVGGPRWRVWSSKKLIPEWTGEWQISVVDANGNVLAKDSFTVAAGE